MNASLNRSFDSISPSARSLLLTKALTNIPFAKEAAELIWGDINQYYTQEKLSSLGLLLKLIHFEHRYWSIDQGISELGIKNILEYSSGFSFRGLSMCKNPLVNYIDTDLPQVIENKRTIIQELVKNFCNYPVENFSLYALNVLDESAFTTISKRFPAGPITIVNEGLLMYLEEGQKEQLCSIIHNLLNKTGGYWITADIYRKQEGQEIPIKDFYTEQGNIFLAEHHVEENKFESFKTAEDFFKNCGFGIYKKIEVLVTQLSSIRLLENISGTISADIKGRKKMRETWILKPDTSVTY